MVIEKAYAKLNLSLNVLDERPDGFQNLETIMVPVVDLYDTLYFYERNDDVIEIIDNKITDNIIIKAAKIFQEKYHTKGVDIRLEKRIPLEAGLASGSADLAATLRGLNKLFNLNVPLKELEEIALSLGSDTVFCLYNKAAVCKGRGEILEFIDFPFSFNVWIIRPNFGISTKDVFNIHQEFNVCNKTIEIINNLKENNLKLLDSAISNDLYDAACIVKPKLKEIVDILKDSGINVHMSGSGSTIYLISQPEKDYRKILENILFENEIEYAYLGKHLIKNVANDC
jgi:4-diphosphocytidyl-2-C-methyl-D-erythritol kinase